MLNLSPHSPTLRLARERIVSETSPPVTNPSNPGAAPKDTTSGTIVVHVFGRTDVGRVREHNEDTFVVADLSTDNATLQPEVRTHTVGERGTLFMVADGMGGAAAGEIASEMAVETVLKELKEKWMTAPRAEPEVFATALKLATNAANLAIHQYATEHPENRGMGTTATIAGLLKDTLYLTQVGDSRAYLVRGGEAKQITKDQSLMQKLIEANEMTEEEAEQSDRRNIILQALGPEARIKIDLTSQQIRRGDTLILCSDGLSGQVRRDEIARVVTEEKDLVAVCKSLIDRANENGGPDNITVIAARFDGDGLMDPGTGDSVGHAVFAVADDATPTTPIPTYVRRHSGTPPVGAPVVRDSRKTVETAPEMPARPQGRALMIGLAVLTLLVAAWWLYTAFRDRASAAPARADSAAAIATPPAATTPAAAAATTPAPDSPRTDTSRTPRP